MSSILTTKSFDEIENIPYKLRTANEKYLLDKFPSAYRSYISKEWNEICNKLKFYLSK